MNKIKIYGISILLIICAILLIINDSIIVNANTATSNISAPSYVLVDESGNILLSNNPNERREVASIC